MTEELLNDWFYGLTQDTICRVFYGVPNPLLEPAKYNAWIKGVNERWASMNLEQKMDFYKDVTSDMDD